MKLNTLFLIALISFIYGCCKDEPLYPENTCDSNCITFQGQVYDKNNDKPVENVLIKVEYDDKLIISDGRELGKTYSDAQGYYSYSFPGGDIDLEKGEFILKATKPGYLSNYQIGIHSLDKSDSIMINEPKIVNFDFFPVATLEIKIKIKNPENITSLTTGYNHCDFDYGHGITFGKPNFTEKIIKYYVPGDGCLHIGYSGISSRGNFSESEDCLINAGELKVYEINIE